MGFWKKVKEEIDYTGTNRKTLASETGINIQTINRAIERDSRPYLEEALTIAKFFNKSIEYFLDKPITLKSEKNSSATKNFMEEQKQLYLYRKYHELILNCEKIADGKQNVIKHLAQTLAEEEPSYTSSKN